MGFTEIDLKKVTIIFGRNAYQLIRPLEYKSGEENKPWAVKLPLGRTVSGPLPVSVIRLSGAACHVANEDDIKLAKVVKKWRDMESYGSWMVAEKMRREDKLATENGEVSSMNIVTMLVCCGTEINQLCRTTLRQHWDNFKD